QLLSSVFSVVSVSRRQASGATFLAPMLLVVAHLLLLSTALLGANGQQFQSEESGGDLVTGTISSLEFTGAQDLDNIYYFNDEDGGKIYRLVFCSTGGVPKDVIPIDIPVTVRFDKIVDGVMYSCSRPMTAEAQGLRHRRVLLGESITTPLEPRVLIYITTFCGYNKPAAATVEDVADMFFVGRNTLMKNRNIATYFRTCSYGKVNLYPSNVKILGPVQVPCNGTLKAPHPFSSGSAFSTNDCIVKDNLFKWHAWLDSWASEKYGVNANDYHHRILILPSYFAFSIPGCGGFVGASTTGKWTWFTSTAANAWGTGLMWWDGLDFGDLE
ncbi:hypothetical protein Vretifemale_6523, partial [Volvox reticuliferus]